MVLKRNGKRLLASMLAVGLISQSVSPSFAEAKSAKKPAPKVPFVISDPYVDFSKGTKASVKVTPLKENKGLETVVFQLMNGSTPVAQAAVETDIKTPEKFNAHFDSTNQNYWIKVSVVSHYNGETSKFGTHLAKPVSTSPFTLRIMETTDIHTNFVAYDYYKGAPSDVLGLSKTATLVKQARQENRNTVLVDNGDLLQGTPLATYKAKIAPLKKGEVHPAYKAMNLMGYDIATFGNHEFNYGLPFLNEAINDAKFPYVNANVYQVDKDKDPKNDKNMFTPYKIQEKQVLDKTGNLKTVKIGYIGLVTPQIMDWDKQHLEGKVTARDIVETAQKFVPEMRKKGADVVVAITHSGFNGDKNNKEDVIYELSKVAGIDAITFSHTHKVFPAADEKSLDILFKDSTGKPLPGVDNAKGTINGVAAVQAGYGGNSLGLIDLELQKVKGKWKIVNTQSSTRGIFNKATGEKVAEDPAIVNAVKADVDATIKYVNTPIGKTTAPIHSFFALVQDDPSVQVVTNAQKWYVEKYIASNKPQYKDLPILSVGAPFKAGRNGVEEFTEIKTGDLTIRSAGDLYLYDNTLKALKVKGSVVKEWLEMSAGKFNKIDPKKTEEQALLNDSFPVYNFDVIDGVTYKVDVTKPARYDGKGVKVSDASRIVNLMYNGKPIDMNQEFIVVTNNYRASGGGNFPGIKGSEYVVDSAEENRQILMDYITEVKEINPTADNNWSIAPIQGNVNVTFTSSPKGEEYLPEGGKITYTGKTNEKGFGIYSFDLKKETFTLNLMHTNDTHAQLDKVAKRITAIKEVRADKPDALLVDAGDVFSGSLYFNEFKGQADLEFMNLAAYDVMTLGNHEFDLGGTPEGHKALADFIKGAKFPIVSSNVDFSKDSQLSGLFKDGITSDAAGGTVYNSIVKNVNGEKVGFFGLTTAETASISTPGSVAFENYIAEADKAVDALEAQGVNKIVAVTHLGFDDTKEYDNDQELAKHVDGIDIIVGGHSHTQLNAPFVVAADEAGKAKEQTIIVQAFQYNEFLGTVDVEFDKNGVVKSYAGQLIKLADKADDAQAAEMLKKYSEKIAALKNTPTGAVAEKALLAPRTSEPGNTGISIRNSEFEIGNLITDGMLEKAKTYNKDTVIALQNGGGIRASINAGEITLGEILTTLPFGNTLATMKLSGAEIKAALEHGVKIAPAENGAFLHVAGMKFTYDSKKPAGERVVSMDVKNADGTFTAIDPAKEYVVATNAFTAKGGDGFTGFKKIYEAGGVTDLGISDWEIFRDYVAKLKNVNPAIEGRIVDAGK
ncbi:bifunctional 2',3'-cyclic-nucleotide 2'-phosphodiesterase/3'-nucleotidase [Fictibacillus iocasae]|uniref:Bifunctional 2',3'-cyclic-nucleotide 2'-phosphodiesterase/3'-nucleotidase n=1 Tax=Fictibacillus iocasae TaxID=2715437 RepID=A0ABW2NQ46_9BACL